MASGKTKKRSKKMALLPLVLLCLIFVTPTASIVLAGLIPGLGAWLLDRDKHKLTAITVLALNTAAIIPLLLYLWSNGNTISLALSVLSSPLSWLLLFAASGVGWFLAYVIPAIIVSIITSRNKTKLDKIRVRQKELVEEWGASITEAGR
jgi:hypothetical protein